MWCLNTISAVLTAVLLSSASLAQTPVPAVPVDTGPENPVLRIGIDGHWACSGVYLNVDFVLTAGHCFTKDLKATLSVGTSDGRTLEAYLAAISLIEGALDDWALLWVRGSTHWTHGAKLDCRKDPLPVGTLIEGVGYPGSVDTLVRSWGRLATLPVIVADSPWNMPIYIAQLPVGHGSSGGPVFEPDGRVFATIVGLHPEQGEWSVIQDVHAVCAVLHLPEDSK